jgi:FAD/FMN-containing dehydrogenase
MRGYQSWGRYSEAHQEVRRLFWRPRSLPPNGMPFPVLPYGSGRSYGDVCLNHGGGLLDCRGLDRILLFDDQQGVLACEAGASLAEILALIVPRGWFLPVTPGTSLITVGGAIANDVHGKNHHQAGTFGRHVRRLELLRSDGSKSLCSASENPELFAATMGGLGLTGLITWAEIQLKPIASPHLVVETIKFHGLDEFLELSRRSDKSWEYTVAWLDALSVKNPQRGLFMRANHLPQNMAAPSKRTGAGTLISAPFDWPAWVLNQWALRAFNLLYYHRQRRVIKRTVQHYAAFLYPLDAIDQWSRIYGRRGMMQFQCVVPFGEAEALREILGIISRAGAGSFLAVLKAFGQASSPGLLSFPRPGITFALDFAFQGAKTLALFQELIGLTRSAGGALYPAKDACMGPEDFEASYPNWRELADLADPSFSSSFWRRVTQGERELLP